MTYKKNTEQRFFRIGIIFTITVLVFGFTINTIVNSNFSFKEASAQIIESVDITKNKLPDKEILLKEINEVRVKNKFGKLKLNNKLDEAAQKKLELIFKNNNFEHNPDGTDWKKPILESNYNYTKIGENLAKGFDNESEIVEFWLKSPKHAENMLDSEYTETGISVDRGVLDGKEVVIVAQEFGYLKN
jgi:uncharacterized protein YkwD